MKYIHGGDVYTHEGMLDFSANINPLGPSEMVVWAARDAVSKMDRYPDPQCRRLRDAVAAVIQTRGEYLVFGNGAADLIFTLVLAEKPKKALLLAPAFEEYKQALQAVDCEIIYFPLFEEDHFSLSERYLECLNEDIDIIFLCVPANPVGNVIEKELLIKILEKCKKYRIRMVVDECFYEFLDNWQEATLHREAEMNSELFVLRAFTKVHAMPGIRLGYGLCRDQALLTKMEAVRQPWGVSVVAQAAGTAAVYETDRVARTRELIREERQWMTAEFERIGVNYYPPAANFIFMKSDYDLDEALKEQHILIRDCSNFTGLETGYYRIAVRCREENQKLLTALEYIYGSPVRPVNG